MRRLGIRTKAQYLERCCEDTKLPNDPASHYGGLPLVTKEYDQCWGHRWIKLIHGELGVGSFRDFGRFQWGGWQHFLLKRITAKTNEPCLYTFEEATNVVRAMGVENAGQYQARRLEDSYLPSCPDNVYSKKPNRSVKLGWYRYDAWSCWSRFLGYASLQRTIELVAACDRLVCSAEEYEAFRIWWLDKQTSDGFEYPITSCPELLFEAWKGWEVFSELVYERALAGYLERQKWEERYQFQIGESCKFGSEIRFKSPEESRTVSPSPSARTAKAVVLDWRQLPNGKEKYQAYLASREWALKKQAVRERCSGICEHCGEEPMYSVHHQTYARLYCEDLADLLGVCDDCHRYLSGK